MLLNRVPSAFRVPAAFNIYVPLRGFQLEQKEEDYKRYYRTLGVTVGSDQDDVRRAFVSLVKKYHPDSDSPTASSEKFHEIEHAYRMLQNKFAKDKHSKSCEGEYGLYFKEKWEEASPSEVKEVDIKHTAPQHRQYLSFDGQGIGTPSERQKQHQKLRAAIAVENVYNHRIIKLQSKESLSNEDSLIVQDKKKAKDIKTRYGIERLVEDLIQESMARGEFDNLQGSGKPLKQQIQYNPYVDFVTHKMNQIMINNGFIPVWITLQKEIKEETEHIKSALGRERAKFSTLPLPAEDEHLWAESIRKLEKNTTDLNKKIEKFNLIVPILKKQMLQFNLDKESNKVLQEGKPKEISASKSSAKKLDVQTKGSTGTILDLLNTALQRVYRQ